MDIMRSGKIGLWSTRGIEDKNCNGYNQVTPRLFELLTCCCHVIARYPMNPDTRYFELDKLCPSIDNYEIFEQKIEEYLHTDVDMDCYTTYMNKHYTSNRVKIIKNLLY